MHWEKTIVNLFYFWRFLAFFLRCCRAARRKCASLCCAYRGMLGDWKMMVLARSKSEFGAAAMVSIVHPASLCLDIRSVADRRVFSDQHRD
jgi:hypothetical protein